jgi:apolipoprotein N-acyltransferase
MINFIKEFKTHFIVAGLNIVGLVLLVIALVLIFKKEPLKEKTTYKLVAGFLLGISFAFIIIPWILVITIYKSALFASTFGIEGIITLL